MQKKSLVWKWNDRIIMISLVLIGLLVIFSYSMDNVSAASSSTIYVSTQGNDNWNGLYAKYTSGNNGPKATVKKAVSTVASGGTVYIASGTYKENQISINKNMTINGAGQTKTIINGGGSGQVFNIAPSVKVTLNKLAVTNGYCVSGGAIENQGKLAVNSCTFSENKASGTSSDGGAIANKGTLYVSSCSFTSNTAYYGGAIFNMKDANIINTYFKGNVATNSGGAISNYLYKLTIKNSQFTSNKADQAGGAVENQGTLSVTGSKFTSNTVPGTNGIGGAIESKGSINLENCTFTSNTVTPELTTEEGLDANGATGGAVCNLNSSDSINTFKNVTFIGNSAPYGGAIDNFSGTLKLINCTFKGNKACVGGGAIENEGTGILSVIGTTTFTENVASWGGAIFNCYKCTLTGTTFTNNKAATAGGTLVNEGVSFDVNSCTFSGSTAGNNGGFLTNNANMSITGSTFKYGKTKIDGGAVDNQGTMTIKGSKFYKNTVTSSSGNGGAIENQGTLTLSDGCVFSYNYAYYGGAVCNTSNATISGCSFYKNSSGSGGAICNESSLDITSSKFTSNKAVNAGGAIENHGTVTAKNSAFTSNLVTSTQGVGGAIYNTSVCNCDGSNTFKSNSAATGANVYTYTK